MDRLAATAKNSGEPDGDSGNTAAARRRRQDEAPLGGTHLLIFETAVNCTKRALHSIPFCLDLGTEPVAW